MTSDSRSLIKKECNEIIDIICDGIGCDANVNEDKTLKQSSKKVLKRVLEDSQMGEPALNYFRGLKEESGKSTYKDLALEEGGNEFQRRVKDVQEFLNENSRKLRYSDLVSTRVFDKKQVGASVLAATAMPVVATFGVVDVVTHPKIVANSIQNLMKNRRYHSIEESNRPQDYKGITSAISAWAEPILPEYIKENSAEIQKGDGNNRRVVQIITDKDKKVLFEKMTGDLSISQSFRSQNSSLGHSVV